MAEKTTLKTTSLETFWSAPLPAQRAHGFARNLAVVIGINAYSNGIPTLTTAVNDAQQVARALHAHHHYATHLLTENVTFAQLTTVFAQLLPQQVGRQDRLLVYFAGHGIAMDGDDGPAGYLILQDSSPHDRQTFLPMDELQRWLNALACRHLLLVLDCCFAGAFRWASQRDVLLLQNVLHKERYDRFIKSPAWQVVTSAAYDQTALDLLAGDVKRGMVDVVTECHSPFAQAFLEALDGAGDLVPKGGGDGVITATELYMYLRDAVEVRADKQANHAQTPGLWPLKKHDKGEYIFLVPNHALNLPPAPNLTAENNPYRGLQAYERDHAKLFFGRDQQIAQLAAVLATNPLTVVLGASGTGKSSLVKAGLVPYLQPETSVDQSASSGWHVLAPMRPGNAPLQALAHLFSELTVDEGTAATARVDVAFAGSSPILPLHSKLTRWFAFHPGQRLLLIIDQFEESITLTRDVQARQQFQQSLAELLQHHSDNLRIILTLRTDFETQFADSPLAAHWQTGRYVVPPLTQADLRAVIEGPAAERVLYFEPPELVDKLIDEVIQTPGALPLLSFTLSEMYIKYVASGSDNRALAQEYYEELGGVIGSLRTRATQEYEQLPDDRYRATMRRMMLRMISTEGGEVARRRVPLSELVYPDAQENEQVAVVLDRLVAVRLLVRDSADVDEDGSKDPYVEPAHDALVRAWDKLLEWRHKAEGYLPLQRRVSQAARTWHGADDASKPGLLWNNDPGLPQLLPHIFQQSSALRAMTRAIGSLWMMDHLDDKPDWLNQVESDFVHKSLQQRTRIRQRIVAITLAVMVGLAGLALYASRQALENKSVALASSAQQAMQSRNRDLAIALGLAAIDLRNPPALAVNALAAASFGPGTQVTPFAAHTDAIVAVALSPDGNTAVSAALDGRTFVWDARTNEIHHMLHEPAPVTKALFSPMGRDVLLGFQDGSLIMWDTTSGNIVHRYTGYQAPISAMAYSVDGKHALVGDEQGTLLLWDMGNKTQVRELVRQDGAPLGAITAVAFSHNGLQALASTGDGQISRWDLASGDEIQRIDSRNRAVLMVAFAQDDTYLFAGYSDGFVRLWDTTTGRGTRSFLMAEHTQGIDAMTVAHDGTTMATGAWDGSVILWGRPEVGGMIHALVGHRAPVVTLAYSQDGRFVLSGSKDGTVRLWDVSAPTLLRRFWVGPLRSGGPPVDTSNYVALDPVHRRVLSAAFDAVVLVNLDTGEEEQTILVEPDYLASVALSHDGETALIGQEGHIIVRNLAHQEEVRRFEPKSGESGLPIHMTFSTDDRTVFAAFEDGTLSAWAVATGEQLWEYLIPSTILWSVAFSQDGKYAVSVDEDKRVVLWDLQTGSEMRRFAGDEDFKGHEDAVYDVALSDDGARLLTASADRRIILWEVATGRPLRTFEGHSLPVRTVAFGPGEATVLSGSEDRTVRLWDISTGTEQFRFEGHSTTVQDVLPLPNVSQPKAWLIFSRDMRSGHIVWQPPPTDVQEIVADTHANRYVRALTCDERLLYKVSPLCQGE